MDTNKPDRTAPLKPYDDSMWDCWGMYENMPYMWDPGLNYDRRLTAVSGNIIKSYRCLIKEPYEVKN